MCHRQPPSHYLPSCEVRQVTFALSEVIFVFKKGNFSQIVLPFYFSLSCFLLGKQLFAWQKWMWSIGENERPFSLQRKLPFAFAKKSKTYETNPQIFPCLQTLWKRDFFFPPAVRIFSHTILLSSKNDGLSGGSHRWRVWHLINKIEYHECNI